MFVRVGLYVVSFMYMSYRAHPFQWPSLPILCWGGGGGGGFFGGGGNLGKKIGGFLGGVCRGAE